MFYHLPSLEALGFDVKADVSLLLVMFMTTLMVNWAGRGIWKRRARQFY